MLEVNLIAAFALMILGMVFLTLIGQLNDIDLFPLGVK